MMIPRFGDISWSCVGIVMVLALMHLLASRAEGGLDVFESDDFSLQLGLRMQPRWELERVSASGSGKEWQRDFLIRRARLKANGKVHGANYLFEWKIDGTDRINGTPTAAVENAYIQYPLGGGVEMRAGLYDQPFSRERLTSDSKQLAVDRAAVSDVPDKLGLADNAVGFHFLGKVRGGRAEYALGLFDNRMIPGGFQDSPMVVGRVDLNFGSTESIFEDTHFGDESWYSVGLDGSYQGSIEDSTGADEGTNRALGIDGMIDVPFGSERLFVRSEVNLIRTVAPGGGNAVDTSVWMVGLGFLILKQRFQPMVRFDQIRLDDAVGGGTRDITYVGANFYQKGHNLKVQGDVRFEGGTGELVDGVRLQSQVDF